mmetsp:Transcript_116765/g.341862  ORF Transcript_116765/g.341862 Transcript_116765/m.341862 type:complete len:220 (+) Transcript_116765:328-987(+)
MPRAELAPELLLLRPAPRALPQTSASLGGALRGADPAQAELPALTADVLHGRAVLSAGLHGCRKVAEVPFEHVLQSAEGLLHKWPALRKLLCRDRASGGVCADGRVRTVGRVRALSGVRSLNEAGVGGRIADRRPNGRLTSSIQGLEGSGVALPGDGVRRIVGQNAVECILVRRGPSQASFAQPVLLPRPLGVLGRWMRRSGRQRWRGGQADDEGPDGR